MPQYNIRRIVMPPKLDINANLELFCIIRWKRKEEFLNYIENISDVNAVIDMSGCSLLSRVIFKGMDIDCVRAVLTKGADVCLLNNNGRSVFEDAIHHEDKSILNFLLRQEGGMEVFTSVYNERGMTAQRLSDLLHVNYDRNLVNRYLEGQLKNLSQEANSDFKNSSYITSARSRNRHVQFDDDTKEMPLDNRDRRINHYQQPRGVFSSYFSCFSFFWVSRNSNCIQSSILEEENQCLLGYERA